jgi:hypothetical protein
MGRPLDDLPASSSSRARKGRAWLERRRRSAVEFHLGVRSNDRLSGDHLDRHALVRPRRRLQARRSGHGPGPSWRASCEIRSYGRRPSHSSRRWPRPNRPPSTLLFRHGAPSQPGHSPWSSHLHWCVYLSKRPRHHTQPHPLQPLLHVAAGLQSCPWRRSNRISTSLHNSGRALPNRHGENVQEDRRGH